MSAKHSQFNYFRLKTEIDEVVGNKKCITYDDIGKLTYLSMTIKETLRLYPVASGTTREVLTEHTFNGHKMPANTTYAVGWSESVIACHHLF